MSAIESHGPGKTGSKTDRKTGSNTDVATMSTDPEKPSLRLLGKVYPDEPPPKMPRSWFDTTRSYPLFNSDPTNAEPTISRDDPLGRKIMEDTRFWSEECSRFMRLKHQFHQGEMSPADFEKIETEHTEVLIVAQSRMDKLVEELGSQIRAAKAKVNAESNSSILQDPCT